MFYPVKNSPVVVHALSIHMHTLSRAYAVFLPMQPTHNAQFICVYVWVGVCVIHIFSVYTSVYLFASYI